MGAMGWGTRPLYWVSGTGYEPTSRAMMSILRPHLSPKFYTPSVDEELQSFTTWYTSGAESSAPIQFAVYEVTGGLESASLLYEYDFTSIEQSDYIAGTTEEIPRNERPTLLAGKTYALAMKVLSGTWQGYGFYTDSVYWLGVGVGADPWPDPSVWSEGGLYDICGLANTRPKRATRVEVKQNWTIP